jgi:prefoldin subunit 5
MEMPTKVISLVGSGFAALVTLYGGATFTHDKLQQIDAMESNIVLVEMRLDLKLLTDRANAIQQRLWKITERYGEDLFEAPGMVREEYQALKKEMEAVNHELTAVQEEYRRSGKPNSSYYEKR